MHVESRTMQPCTEVKSYKSRVNLKQSEMVFLDRFNCLCYSPDL